jgi:hypothetical protein
VGTLFPSQPSAQIDGVYQLLVLRFAVLAELFHLLFR